MSDVLGQHVCDIVEEQQKLGKVDLPLFDQGLSACIVLLLVFPAATGDLQGQVSSSSFIAQAPFVQPTTTSSEHPNAANIS